MNIFDLFKSKPLDPALALNWNSPGLGDKRGWIDMEVRKQTPCKGANLCTVGKGLD